MTSHSAGSTPTPHKSRLDMGRVVLIFLSALMVRLTYIYEISDAPSFYNLFLDCGSYDRWAIKIASGQWFGAEVFYQDPLYPYFLASIYELLGRDLYLIRVIQAVIGSLNCVLIFLMGRELYGKKAAMIAGFISAFYGVFIFFDGMVNKPFLGLFLFDLSLLAFITGLRKKRGVMFFLSGAGLGLSVLVRANILVLIPLFLYWTLVKLSRSKSPRFCVYFLAGTVLALAPAAINNYAASGEFLLTTSQAGQNFYIGNHPDNNTGTYLPPMFLRGTPEFEQADFKSQAEFLKGKKLSPSQVSSFWMNETLKVIEADPIRSLKRLMLKARLFLNKYEVPDNLSYGFFKAHYSSILRINPLDFRLVGSLGLAGLILSFFLGGEERQARFLPLLALAYMASIIPFYIFSRYRLPVVPLFILGAAFFLVYLNDRVKARDIKKIFGALLALVFSIILVNADIKKDDFSYQFGNIGFSFFQKGEFKEALDNYKKALEINPAYAEPHYFLGRIYTETGEIKKAEESFRMCVKISPEIPLGHSALGILLARTGRLGKARIHLETAARLRPNDPAHHNNLGMVHALLGELELARAEFKRAIDLDPGFKKARENFEKLRTR